MRTLEGRHALVTGGGSGIGAAIARALAGAGAAVTVAGRQKERLAQVAGGLKNCFPVAADVTRASDCESMVFAARQAHGPLDIIVANAGAAESAPFDRIDRGHWQRMLDVNLTGAFLTVQAGLADLTREDAGQGLRRIVFVASTAGLKGYPYVAAYCAAKHGVIGLTRALALEVARTGITVNAVCPGYTETSIVDGAIESIVERTGRSQADARQVLLRRNPQRRLVSPDEVAATVAWLCLPESRSINGQAISLSGGEVMTG